MFLETIVTDVNTPTRSDAAITAKRAGVEIRLRGDLDVASARPLCQALEAQIAAGATDVAINLEAAKACDVVGLAALLQSAKLCSRRGVEFSILPGAALHADLLKAQLLEELPFVTALFSGAQGVDLSDGRAPGGAQFLAHTPRLGLRTPTWEELPLFERWANDPLLDQMVGSELLYRCRHLGPYHPDFVSAVLSDPTSLTLLVEPVDPPRPPVGFVRLYAIQLAQQFAFLETAVASPESLRRGWGIEASRLLLAYAC